MTVHATKAIYFSVPFTFTVSPITFKDTAINTIVGGAVRVDATNEDGTKVAGTATIASATSITCSFAIGALAVGEWSVQTMATPIGGAADIVSEITLTVMPGAAP